MHKYEYSIVYILYENGKGWPNFNQIFKPIFRDDSYIWTLFDFTLTAEIAATAVATVFVVNKTINR